MVRIVFDRNFDSGSWPGPLSGKEASAGELWVGLAGLAGRLETELGLAFPRSSQAARVSALVPAIRKTEGFWSESAETDPLGTAATLLGWRDFLWMHGWQGQPVSPRLEQLSGLTRPFIEPYPGLPDRLAGIARVMQKCKVDIESITLFTQIGKLPLALRSVMNALGMAGVSIQTEPIIPVLTAGDLMDAREGGFEPRGDGTLQLLRPHGALAAAEEVAAWLASLDSLEGSVLVGHHPLLDAALRRHGLPTTGSPSSAESNAVLQVLPLVLEMAWDPPDPQRALELLTLPRSPVPRNAAKRLAKALQDWPAIGSDDWNRSYESSLEGIKDRDQREKAKQRMAGIFNPCVRRGKPYPVAEIRKRIDLVRQWAGGFLGDEDEDRRPWFAAEAQLSGLEENLDLSGFREIPAPLLNRFLRLATESGTGISPYPAEAGLTVVHSPGSIVGPAENVVWWSFRSDSVPAIMGVPLTKSEKIELAGVGADVPSPAEEAARIASEWRRPFEQAFESMLLVCPRLGEGGDELHPHPLWDEIVAGMPDDRLASKITVSRPVFRAKPPARKAGKRLQVPVPRRDWKVGVGVAPKPRRVSPTGLSTFLGCPFKWAIDEQAETEAGIGSAVSGVDDTTLIGSITHHVLEQVFGGGSIPADPSGKAEKVFDRDLPRLASVFLLPGAESARVMVRTKTAAAAGILAQLLRDNGLKVSAVERKIEGRAFGIEFAGKMDMVAEPGDAVIDLKWSGANYRETSLKNGTSYQLASYAYLLTAGKGSFPECGFFILSTPLFIPAPPGALGHAAAQGPGLRETWAGIEAAAAEAIERISRGELFAGANPDKKGEGVLEEDALEGGVLRIAAPCAFCGYGVLCGNAFAGG